MLVAGSATTPFFAYGCDSFGYLRQAHLFHAKGWWHGLNTHVRNEQAEFLIKTAKSLNVPYQQWAEMVAPHAHHYNAKTDAIILQYPPGTGFLLSLLPDDRGPELTTVLAAALIALGFLLAAARRSLAAVEMVALAAALLFACQLLVDFASFGTYSVPWTFAFIPVAALAAVQTTSGGKYTRYAAGVVLGFLCALLLLTRIPNIFIVAALGLFLLIQAGLDTRHDVHSRIGVLVAAGLPFLLFGALPLVVANRVNAGGLLASTYSPADAAPPSFAAERVWSNVQYYLQSTPAWRALLLSFLVTGCAVAAVFAQRYRGSRRFMIGVASAVSLTFGASVVFFFSHPVQNPYYMAPGCMFVVCFGLFGFIEAQGFGAKGRDNWSWVFAVLAVAAIAAIFSFQVMMAPPQKVASAIPQDVANPNSIVWSDLTSGTMLYYNGKYAAKLGFGSTCLQDRMVQAVYQADRPQYFVVDSPTVQGIVDRLSKIADFEPAGTFDTRYPAPIVKLKDFKGPVNCQ